LRSWLSNSSAVRIEVFHDQLEPLACRNLKLQRLEAVVLDGELIGEFLAIARYPERQSQNPNDAQPT